jgi:N-acetylneuraminate synthase/N,N'-diacetyllegionaminate synthase
MRTLQVGAKRIGPGERPFVVAEAGVNHNGDPDLALRLVDAAADAGADAVKFQTFDARALSLADAPQATYQRERAAAGSQRDMLLALELSEDALRATQARAAERGIAWFSTPFDIGSLELLADLGVPVIKIGSGDLTDLPLLRAAAAIGLPMIVSTGMATLQEVALAVEAVRTAGDPPLALLQCVSAYPADAADVNLRAMETLRERFDVPVGFSDHTLGIGAPIASAALGAAMIEKHLTLDVSLPGPDHAASLEPSAFTRMVTGIREATAALGDGRKEPRPEEEDVRRVARRSLTVARPVPARAVLAAADLDAMRPADGISPLRIDEVIGRSAARDLIAGERLRPDDMDPPLD